MANAKHIRMIEQAHTEACEKHPKFCDRCLDREKKGLPLQPHGIAKENTDG